MEYLLKASAVVFLFYLCYSLFLKKETFFQHNRWFLLIGITTAIVFPLVVIPVEILVEPTAIPETAFYIENTNPTTITQTEQSFQWQNVLPIVYVAGLVIFLIQFMLQFGSLIFLLFKNQKTKDGIYTYIIVKSKVSPFSFFKWIVYNPELFEEEELQLILNHEKVHVRQLHSIDIVLTRLACVIFWFNPIMWMYKNQIHQNLEYIADDETQNSAQNDKDYQRLLVKTSVANQHIPITTNFYNSLIKKRIIMLNKSRSNQVKQWKLFLVIPLLTGLLLSMNTKEVFIEKPTNNETSSEIPLNTIKATSYDFTYETIEYIFKKDMTDAQLEKIQSDLKEKGVTMEIEELDRNDSGEISSIRVSFKTELSSANYGVSDSDGIKPFVFRMNDMGGIKVGTLDESNTFTTTTKTKGENVYIIRKENEDIDEEDKKEGNKYHYIIKEDGKGKIIELKGNANIWTDDEENTFTFEADTIQLKGNNSKEVIVTGYGKGQNNTFIKKDSTKLRFRSSNSEPVYIINGKRVDKDQLKVLDPKRINSLDVIKGDKATTVYGTAGENGVIVIRADSVGNYNYKFGSGENSKIKLRTTEDGPWKLRTEVSSVEYIDTDDINKTGFSYYVSKTTTDKQFGVYKSELEKRGIKAKFSKIKRNSAGEITSIKISLSDEDGSKASATWRDDEETIPKILVGKKGGKLRVSSSNF